MATVCMCAHADTGMGVRGSVHAGVVMGAGWACSGSGVPVGRAAAPASPPAPRFTAPSVAGRFPNPPCQSATWIRPRPVSDHCLDQTCVGAGCRTVIALTRIAHCATSSMVSAPTLSGLSVIVTSVQKATA